MIQINKIYCEKGIDTMRRMPDGFINLTITSPPYDKLRSYKSQFDSKLIAAELFRVTNDGGVCVWIVSDQTTKFSESGSSFKQALNFIAAGWCLFDTMIWKKKNPMPGTKTRYMDEFEYMFVFSKGKPATFNPIKIPCVTAGQSQKWSERPHESKVWKKNGIENRVTLAEKIKGNVWEYSTGLGGSTNDKIAFEHPAIFPEQLVRDHIFSWSKPGDLIYDCFMGSGTTAKIAYLMNRNYLGSELEKKYVEIATKRLSIYNSQHKMKLDE